MSTFDFTEKDSLKYKKDKHGICLAGMSLNGVSVLGKSFSFHYRYLDQWGWSNNSAPWKEIVWNNVSEKKDSISFIGDIRRNDDPKNLFNIKMTIRKNSCSFGGKNFSGIGVEFQALSEIPFAMEIEVGVPLSKMFRESYVQDLYTADKCSSISEKWAGVRSGNWQWQRSPFDFYTSDKGVLLSRINSLDQLFSSGAELDGNSPFLKYKYTLESCSKWKTPELSFLFCRGTFDQIARKDLWGEIFLSESARFRKQVNVREEEVLPMANIPIDGGTPGCNPLKDRRIQGTFDEFAEEAISICEKMNFKRMLVGSPWISYRSKGMFVKTQPDLVYDSRCGIIDFEIAKEYGGRNAFRIFCDKAHEKGIEVFVWYPGFHLANHSHHLTEHPEWIIRKHDGSPYTYVFFHLTAISPRLEVQKYFLDNLKTLKKDCGFDGLWLDSYSFSFQTLDYSRKQGVSDAREGILMIKRLQDLGFKVINEGYAPFGIRGDGEAMFFKGQEEAAVETSLFTYYKNIPEILKDDSYFRFLANKAPLTLAARHIPKKMQKTISVWNKAFNSVEKFMQHRKLLENNRGVLWSGRQNVKILFSYADMNFDLENDAVITDLISGKKQIPGKSIFIPRLSIYKIEYK